MKLYSIKAREDLTDPKEKSFYFFNFSQALDYLTDSCFFDYEKQLVFAVSGIKKEIPICSYLLNNKIVLGYLSRFKDVSNLFNLKSYKHITSDKRELDLPSDVIDEVNKIEKLFSEYGGKLNEKGEHIINLKTPLVGTHYGVNLLIGDRSKTSNPLQTTPKSVVDQLGRGSFRAQAAFQVLATKWDLRIEENGFPANRQFYLIENNEQIFYSALIDENVIEAKCNHSQNKTTITYKLACGLTVIRTIFMLPQYKGLPDATEIQTIRIINNRKKERKIKIVYTGMFGSTNTDAISTDILYANLISQSRIIKNELGEIIALSPDYYPEYAKNGVRFITLKTDDGFADEFETDIMHFIGNGTLEKPQYLLKLSNKLMKRGPQFFALAKELNIRSCGKINIDTFTGVVNAKSVKNNEETEQLLIELEKLIEKYKTNKFIKTEINKINKNYNLYRNYLQVKSNDIDFDTYVNYNLPFQVYYQTFVSRSFAQTQKGYREIGFREIQDLFASMYYLENAGKDKLIQSLLIQWANNVYEMGYANHNFYFTGKEPGKCSDDQLWLFQAVHRYISLTGNISFVNKHCKIYGTKKTRTIYETLKAILQYSAEISIGKHGLPILDSADWNDCLKIDNDWIDGVEKENQYLKQLKNKKQNYGVPFENNYCESIMNAFLLIIALEQMKDISRLVNDDEYALYCENKAKEIRNIVNEKAFVKNYYARVLINNPNIDYKYIGTCNDGLSNDPNIPGSYYLNSFSWSILSDTANEEQISLMLDVVEKYLKCDAGFKLCTNHNLLLVGANEAATEQYFLGDRENGGVFKHATMMAVVAMLKASKIVKNKELQARLVENSHFMLDLVYPYKNLDNPLLYKGNPRFCTQYINSISKENIGPILSGTASWLTLAIYELLGIEIIKDGFIIKPSLKKEEKEIEYNIKLNNSLFIVKIEKESNYCDYNNVDVYLNNIKQQSNKITYKNCKKINHILIHFK